MLQLTIDKSSFDDIANGVKTIESLELKPSTLGRYTYVDKKSRKRYPRYCKVLKFNVNRSEQDRMLVRVEDIRVSEDAPNIIQYHLGKIIEIHHKDEAE